MWHGQTQQKKKRYYYMTYYCISSSIFLSPLIFNWRIITLQHCVGFCHRSTWISHRYTHVLSLLKLFPASYPISPLLFVPEYRIEAPCHIANSHWLSILHMVIHTFQCYYCYQFLTYFLFFASIFSTFWGLDEKMSFKIYCTHSATLTGHLVHLHLKWLLNICSYCTLLIVFGLFL